MVRNSGSVTYRPGPFISLSLSCLILKRVLMRTGLLKRLIQSGRGSICNRPAPRALPAPGMSPQGVSALSVHPPLPPEDPCAQLFHHLWPECLEPLTKHLGPREGRELLQAAEEVAVGVGQVSVQLAEVAVPLPDHHLRGTGT